MRTHERYREYVLLHDPQIAREIVAADRLVAARFEPVMSVLPEASLDLIFERDGRYVVLTSAYVIGSMLELRESPPIVWPASVRPYADEATFEAIEAYVEPWLAELTLAAFANDECFRVFTHDERVRSDLERARSEGLYGTTSLVRVMRSIGPYVYGYRFARDADAAVRDANGANGAALLVGRCNSVALDLRDADREAFAQRWFAAQRFEEPAARMYGVAFCDTTDGPQAQTVVHVSEAAPGDRELVLAHPIPAASLVSLDPDDSVPDRRFGVRTGVRAELRRSVAAAPLASGGSGGRILFIARDDWAQTPDADTEAIRTLQSWLVREGFSVDITGASTRIDPSSADVVHVVGHRHVGAALASLEALAAAGVPIVASPYADDAKNDLPWGGNIELFAFRNGLDAETIELYVEAVGRRKLAAAGVDALPRSTPIANPDLKRLLDFSGAALASGAEEERLLRDLYGFANPVLHAPAYLEAGAEDGAEGLAGLGEFMLVHAPIDTAPSLLFVLSAAARTRLPLVWTGPVAHPEVLHHARSFAPDTSYFVPPKLLSEAEVAGLYARARIYVDAGWAARGLNRAARAASYGATVVASTAGYARDVLGDAAFVVDPASVDAIASAMRAAWDAAPARRDLVQTRAAERFGGVAALVSTVTAYSQAAARAAASQPA